MDYEESDRLLVYTYFFILKYFLPNYLFRVRIFGIYVLLFIGRFLPVLDVFLDIAFSGNACESDYPKILEHGLTEPEKFHPDPGHPASRML